MLYIYSTYTYTFRTSFSFPLLPLACELPRDLENISHEELEKLRDPKAQPESQRASQVCEESCPAEVWILRQPHHHLGVKGENQSAQVLTSLL